MPEFKRNYSLEWVTKYQPSIEWRAKQLEGHDHMQEALEGLGATELDGIYQMDSVPAKEQFGLLIDFWSWENHKTFKVGSDVDAARSTSVAEAQDDFEHGGIA